MDITLTPLSQLDAAGLARLTALHCSVMHTLLVDLGAPLVLRYYQIAQNDPSVLGLCAISPDGEILGWTLGSPAPALLNARLRQPLGSSSFSGLPWFTAQVLRVAFTRPIIFIELIRSALSASPINTIPAGQIELTYIGVATSAQGQGLGTALLTAFMDGARSAGFTSVALSVETDNPAAIALYTRSGFHITQTYSEGRFERHRMVCDRL